VTIKKEDFLVHGVFTVRSWRQSRTRSHRSNLLWTLVTSRPTVSSW